MCSAVCENILSPVQRIGLQLKATLENVTNLGPGEEFRWYLKVCYIAVERLFLAVRCYILQLRCANCGETTQKWVYATSQVYSEQLTLGFL